MPSSLKKPTRYLNGNYLDMIRMQGCVYCSKGAPSNPHHVKKWFSEGGGWGTKVSDLFTVPVCDKCHRQIEDGILEIPDREYMDEIADNMIRFARLNFTDDELAGLLAGIAEVIMNVCGVEE